MIPNKLLLPCRSEATYNYLIRHLLGWIGFLTQAYHEIHSLGMLRGAFYMIIRSILLALSFRVKKVKKYVAYYLPVAERILCLIYGFS